jgi:uncharacterized protein (TIGR00251 family)
MSSRTRLRLKVVPGASRTESGGWLGDALKVRVAAPPEKGQANAAVLAWLAATLGLPVSALRIVTGHGAPRKTVEIDGISAEELRRRLAGG